MNNNNTTRFSMKEWSPITVYDKKLKIEREIEEIQKKRQPLIDRKREIEMRLSEINSKFKTRAGDFSNGEYAGICKEQDLLKVEKFGIEEKLRSLKIEGREKRMEENEVFVESKKYPDEKLKDTLLEIRDKYMSFAADTTRVSSMRAMASRFVEEIQGIMKYVE